MATGSEQDEKLSVRIPIDAETEDTELVGAPSKGITAFNSKMVSGNDHEVKSSVDYVTSGIDEIKHISNQILALLSTLQQQQQLQVSHAAEGDPQKLGSVLTELHKNMQQIRKYCADVSTIEKEMRTATAEQQTKSEELEQKIAQLTKQYEEELRKHRSDLKELNDEKRYKQEVEKYKEEVQKCKQEVTENKAQVEIHKHEAEHHKSVSDRLEQENKQHQDKEAKYISQIEELKSGNKDQKRENNEQKAKIEDLNKRNEELTKVCKELKEESEKLKNKLETEGVYSYAKKQESKVNELQAEIKNLREKNEELKQKIMASECDLARLRSRDEGKEHIIQYQQQDVDFHRDLLRFRQTHSSVRQNQLEFTKEESESKTVVKSSTL